MTLLGCISALLFKMVVSDPLVCKCGQKCVHYYPEERCDLRGQYVSPPYQLQVEVLVHCQSAIYLYS